MQRLIKTQLVILGSLVTAICLTLATCGGGGSTAGAGGGTTMVAGLVKGGSASLVPEQYLPGQAGRALAALQLLVPGAQAAVYQVTLNCTGGFNDTQSTDANGKFTFVDPGDGSLSGNCDILVNNIPAASLTVASGTNNEVEINDNGGSFTVVKTESNPSNNNVVEVEVENESNDQASNDQSKDDQNSSSEDDGESSASKETEHESEDDGKSS